MATQDTAEAAAAGTSTPPAEEAPKEVKAEETPKQEAKEEPAKEAAENATAEEAPAPAETSAATEETPAGATEEVAATGPVEGNLPSFKEESYFEKDLKESEKKALQEFLEIVETAIKAQEFVLPPKVEVVKETTEVVKASDEAVLVASTVEREIKEGDLEVKVEEAAVAVIATEDVAAEAKSLEPAEVAPKTESAAEAPSSAAEPTTKSLAELVSAEAPAETPAEAPAPEAAPAPKEAPAPEAPEEKKPEEAAPPAEAAATTDGTPAAEAPATEAEVTSEAPAVIETTELIVEEKDLTPPEELELWGVPLLPSKGDPRTKVIFLKFLRARDFKVKDAFTMLKNCILWRKRYGADQILEEDLGTEFDSCAFNHGVDKDGHPVQYNVFGVFQDKDFYQKVFGDPSKTEKALRWRVQLLEKQIQLLNFNPGGVNSILQVVDLKNAPLLGKKGLRSFMSQALNLLTDNYPELVVKLVFLNTPWYFNAIYAFVSPFLTQRMKSKFTIANSLFKFIAPDNIPVQYGGLSRINDAEFGDANASVTELVLKAGEKKTAEIEVSGGEVIVWDFALVGSDVTYGAEFVPSKEGGYTTIVEKPKKITLLEEPLRNSFKSPEAGKLVLSIDNSLSRKKKTALYRYIKKTPDVLAE